MDLITQEYGALYIRVSSNEQIEFSPSAQKRALLNYAKANNILVTEGHIYIDEGISGRKAESRPAFMRMIADAKKKPKQFDVILVHKFDRFARSREDSVVYKSLLRKDCGVKVTSITEQMEDDKFSVILEAMLEAMAEYYSINLSDEVLKGMTEKARRGQYQAAPPLGYEMKDKILVIVPEEAKVVNLVFDKFERGSSPFAIAKMLNALGYKTKRGNQFENRGVVRMLTNLTYSGYVIWNGIEKKCEHEPIIGKERFENIQKLYTSTRRPRRSRSVESQKHWLCGLLYCSSCGSRLASGGHKAGSFQCNAYSKGKCTTSHYVMFTIIERMVLEAILELQNSDCVEYEARAETNQGKEVELLQTAISNLNTKEQRVKSAYINGIDSLEEYKHNREIITKERDRINIEIKKLTPMSATASSIKEKIRGVYDILKSGSYDYPQKQRALSSICNKIIYDKKSESLDVILSIVLS